MKCRTYLEPSGIDLDECRLNPFLHLEVNQIPATKKQKESGAGEGMRIVRGFVGVVCVCVCSLSFLLLLLLLVLFLFLVLFLLLIATFSICQDGWIFLYLSS